MLADPVERTAVKSKRKRSGISISTLAGRGELGVDFRWHNRNEFKRLTSDQKDESSAWRNTPPGKKSMKEAKDKFKAQLEAKKRKQEGGGGNTSSKDDKAEKDKEENQKIAKEIPGVCCKGCKEDGRCLYQS